MSYTPTTWKAGDIVTSAKLNKLEEGVASAGGGGVTVVPYVESGGMDEPSVIQMQASELLTACKGGAVFIKAVDGDSATCFPITLADFYSGQYSFHAGSDIFTAESASEYPASSGGK